MAKRSHEYPQFAPKNVVITIVALAVILTSALFVAAYNQPQNSTGSQTHASYATPTPACRYKWVCVAHNKYGVCTRYGWRWRCG